MAINIRSVFYFPPFLRFDSIVSSTLNSSPIFNYTVQGSALVFQVHELYICLIWLKYYKYKFGFS